MPSTDKMTRDHVRKLAKEGRLVAEAFNVFQRTVFPTAPPQVIDAMRTCFFAGAAELWALQMAAMDDGDDVSADEEAFQEQWVAELEAFHARTVLTAITSSHKAN